MYARLMRTTVDLADDVAAEVARLRRENGLGLSDAVNELARAGLANRREHYEYHHKTHDMGVMIDVSNTADVLELLDDLDRSEGSRHDS